MESVEQKGNGLMEQHRTMIVVDNGKNFAECRCGYITAGRATVEEAFRFAADHRSDRLEIAKAGIAYRLRMDLGHFLGERFPAGTVVSGRPYPADPRYVEITLPDGIMLTVDDGYEVERVEGE